MLRIAARLIFTSKEEIQWLGKDQGSSSVVAKDSACNLCRIRGEAWSANGAPEASEEYFEPAILEARACAALNKPEISITP